VADAGRRRLLVETFAASFVAWYATVPLAAQHFGRISLAGPLATPLVLPPLTGLLVIGFAAALCTTLSLPGAQALFRAAAFFAGLLLKFVGLVAALPFCSFAIVAPGWGLVLVWLAFPVVLLLAGGLRRRALVVLVLSAVLITAWQLHARFRRDQVDIVFVSVGQGDATLIRLPADACCWWIPDRRGEGGLRYFPC